jgi:rubrerythrin
MTKASTIGHIFELSIALEQSAEAFYRGLALRFAHEPEVATFWKKYADEEAGHARWLANLRGQLDAARLRQPLDHVDELIDGAYRLLEVPPEKLLAGITNLEQAYRTAAAMESSETNTIFEFLITNYSIASRSRDFLREQIHNHAEKIVQQFPEAFREPAKQREVKAK